MANGRPRKAAGAFLLHGAYGLFQRRSTTEHEPLSWSIYGGMPETLETPMETAIREVMEEARIDISDLPLLHVDTWVDGPTFAFYTYAVTLGSRVEPVHSVETVDAAWIRFGDTPGTFWANLPYPLHSGLARITRNPAVSRILLDASLKARLAAHSSDPAPDAGGTQAWASR